MKGKSTRSKWISGALAAAVFGALVFAPLQQSWAKASDEIQNKLNQLDQQQKDSEKKKQEAEKLQASLQAKIDSEKLSVEQIQQDIEEQGKELDDLNKQLVDKQLELQQTKVLLAEAEDRVTARDKMLKSKVQLMYMNGSVSYLDVLFSATSFSDFLDRFESLTSLVGKDNEVLAANKQDRDAKTVLKKEQETQLTEQQSLVAQAAAVKNTLLKREKQKEVAIAGLSKQQQQAAETESEQDENVLALIKQKQALRKQLEDAKRKESASAVKVTKPQKVYSGGQLEWPVPSSSTISDVFGYRIDPIKHINKLHKGIDIAAPKGSTVEAAESGEVIIASWVNGYGNTIVIDHGNNMYTWYGHMSKLVAAEGDDVKRGQKIGEVGSTGDSTGNHLHFEVRVGDEAQNPLPYLGK